MATLTETSQVLMANSNTFFSVHVILLFSNLVLSLTWQLQLLFFFWHDWITAEFLQWFHDVYSNHRFASKGSVVTHPHIHWWCVQLFFWKHLSTKTLMNIGIIKVTYIKVFFKYYIKFLAILVIANHLQCQRREEILQSWGSCWHFWWFLTEWRDLQPRTQHWVK